MRLFVALDLPPKAKDSLVDLQQRLLESGVNGRPTRRENLHLTLQFLGEVDKEQTPAICEAMERAVDGMLAPMVYVSGVGAFVRAAGDTVFAQIGGDVMALERLQDAAARALVPWGLRRESRPFTPHITLLRGAAFSNNTLRVRSENFFLSTVCVYASHLGAGPSGAPQYEKIYSRILPR